MVFRSAPTVMTSPPRINPTRPMPSYLAALQVDFATNISVIKIQNDRFKLF